MPSQNWKEKDMMSIDKLCQVKRSAKGADAVSEIITWAGREGKFEIK